MARTDKARPGTSRRELTDPNLKFVGYLCRRIWDTSIRRLQAAVPDLSVTAGQLGTLVLIACNPGITPSQIGRIRGYEKSTVTITLNYLTKKKLILRRPSAHDRRSFAVHLTPTGTQLYKQVLPRAQGIDRLLLRSLGKDEADKLLILLTRIYEAEAGQFDQLILEKKLLARIGSERQIVYPNLNVLGYLCRRVWDLSAQRLRAAIPNVDATDGHLGALVLIASNPGVTPTQLYYAQGREKTTITLAIDSLADKRLITRRLSVTDRRSFVLYVTKAGEELFNVVLPLFRVIDRDLLASLSKSEQRQLTDMLTRVFEHECQTQRPER